jgi:hypothetical protein
VATVEGRCVGAHPAPHEEAEGHGAGAQQDAWLGIRP